MTSPTPSHIKANIFPASITPPPPEPDSNRYTYRAVITDTQLIFIRDVGNTPTIIHEEPLESYSHSHPNYQPNDYLISKATGCGCGSRTKTYNPFPGVPYVS